MHNGERVKVLLIEDNPGDARLIAETLRETPGGVFELACVEDLETGCERLARGGVDVVLLDLNLPHSRGYDTFAQAHARLGDVPIIVLTGLGDQELAVRTVRDGAQDYLVKGQADAHLLGRGIRYAIERNRIQRDLRRLNEELEQRVAERTARLTAANHDLEAFTYSVSHDLRAPLRQVDGFAQLLVEECATQLDPTAKHYLERIRHGTRRMGELVDDLLALAHVGRQELRLRPTALDRLVTDAVAELEPQCRDRLIEWRIGRLPTVPCDPGLMHLVLVNLLSNAIKFTRTRERAVITVDQTTARGGPAVFVQDNGVGFDMKYADKLFGVFQRLHRAEDFEGTGIGLATVQRIVHKHGGEVWAEARPDEGATFFVTLGASPPQGHAHTS